MREALENLLKLVEEIEFIHIPDDHWCHFCGGRDHRQNCELEAAMDAAKEALA